eukprot:UN09349
MMTSNLISDSCYGLYDCNGLNVQYQSNHASDCTGDFEIDWPTVYKKANESIYLYFSPQLFRWVCGGYSTLGQCVGTSNFTSYALQRNWYNGRR